jgi:hypothetical protein
MVAIALVGMLMPAIALACSHTCYFNINKDGYTYSVSATAVYSCSRSWPSWGCTFLHDETLARINPSALSASWNLSCGNTHSYSATIVGSPQPPVNGACGAADGSVTSEQPTTDLCDAGTMWRMTDTGSEYTWECRGTGVGSTASCAATKNACPATPPWVE